MVDIVSKIQEAIITNKVISFNYTNNDGIESKRSVFPYYLKYTGFAVFLKGFCFLRNEERTFNIDKIENLKIKRELITDKKLIRAKIEAMNSFLFANYDKDYY